ncbi:hypothetical protein ACHHYP_10947 [Achlya hypogyna]|uniref:Uncharacterized protein n=1 Tax=Achlya hypogyna TaxID=1202772 RepID=A0A1V9YK95_ACHHY|nr:hypothetical protein ACHHYP_10947 [Achlya hypogyna]
MTSRTRSLAGRAAALEAANAVASMRGLQAAMDADDVLASVRHRETTLTEENEGDDDDITALVTDTAPQEPLKEVVSWRDAVSPRRSSQANWRETIEGLSPRRQSRAMGLERSPFSRPGGRSLSSNPGNDHAEAVADLQAAISKLLASNQATESAITKMVEQMNKMQEDQKGLGRKAVQTTALLEKQKLIQASHEAKYLEAEAELTSKTYALDEARRSETKAAQAAKAIEIRLERALADVEKVKKELHDERAAKGGPAVPRADHDKVLRDVKRTEKQKVHDLIYHMFSHTHVQAELLTAYKKQAKLIDVLKRQKIHLEAAKELLFTEDEFAKTVDLGNL